MKARNIDINGEVLSYLDNEKGDTTLLFIHGAFINKEYWNNQLSYFAPSYRVVALDQAGHGKSSHNRTEWTGQNFGGDLCVFIEKLSLKNVVLIGHSFGSDVMLEAVANDSSSISGLIEVDHMKNVGVALPQEIADQLVQSLKTDFIRPCEQIARQTLVTEKTDPELVDRLLKDYSAMNPAVGVPLLQNGFNYVDRETELLKGLKQKLYLIHVNYTATDEENLKKYLGDNYALQIISGTCHYPMIENPDELNAALEKILSRMKDN